MQALWGHLGLVVEVMSQKPLHLQLSPDPVAAQAQSGLHFALLWKLRDADAMDRIALFLKTVLKENVNCIFIARVLSAPKHGKHD